MKETIIKSIKEKSPNEFLSEYIYDRIPFIFDEDRSSFISWKQQLSKIIHIDPYSILFVGSSALGFSLNPYKNLRPFDQKSDVDLAIISQYHFTMSWYYLRNNSHLRARLDQATITAWDEHVTRLIYWGTIATDKLLGILPFGEEWIQATNEMSRIQPTYNRQINLRIYSDYESLRAYQIMSITKLRETILAEEQ